MTRLTVGIIDVFGETPYSGNPLAVVEDADALTDTQMRAIAREFNQAETTFLSRSNRADWKLRSFTAAGSEVFGAGHNSLGAWLWMAYRDKLGSLNTPSTFRQEIGTEVLPITLERRGGAIQGRMKQAALKLLKVLGDTQSLAASLGVREEDVMRTPQPRVADTGANHLLVRLVDRAAVDRVRPQHEQLLRVLMGVGAEGCYVFAYDLEKPGYAYTRFFNPTVGLWEDSATGTAAGPLCGYLGWAGLLTSERTLRIEQGVIMGRRSILDVKLTPDPELSGSGAVVLEGKISLPT
ncbi:MAG: PhzF family phenazine biosynthesis protein [Proteobacteria bacterium]|nr:PhzF family phenazine biosynthesis protein [Pseudomonadota bacterium]